MEQTGIQKWRSSSPPITPSSITPLDTTAIDLISEQINAGWFIIVVIGFFAFIIISSMVINQLNAEPEEEDVINDFIERQCQTKKKSAKSTQLTPQCYENQGYTDSYTSSTSESQLFKGFVKKAEKTKRDDKKATANQDAVICISTVS